MYQTFNEGASPYARVGAKLVDCGFSAIPIIPGKKRPAIKAWTEYCDHLPDTDSVQSASEHRVPFGVGIALGCNGVIAVDIDTDDSDIGAAIEAVLPESPVGKRGRAGRTWFYRASAAVKTKAFDIGGVRVLDLLAHGRQSIIPPSIHPGTGREYEWLGDPLERFTPESLPPAPDDIAELIAAALKPFGYEAEIERDSTEHGSSGGGWWRETADAALVDLDRWVPALGIGRENVRRKTDGGYRMKAVWRNGDAFNVGITPKGITDWADGAGKGYNAPGLVMEIKGWDFNAAESWLREKLGIQEPERVNFTFREGNSDTAEDSEETVQTSAKPAKPDTLDAITLGRGVDWRRPDGVLGDIAQWITETSFLPNRALAVGAAIATVAPVLGRRLFTPTGAHCGVYVSCIADSGDGKDDPLNAVKRVLNASGLKYLHQTGKAFTGSGYEANLVESPVHVSVVDEGGKNLFSKVLDPRASTAEKALGIILLELYGFKDYSEAFQLIKRARYVSSKTDVEFVTEILMPSLSMYSVSTPGSFYKSVTKDSVEDGLLNRIIQINADPVPEGANYLPEIVPVPGGIVARLHEIASFGNDERFGVPHIPDAVFGHQRRVPFLGATAARQEDFGKAVRRVAKEHPLGDLFKRVPENALRLATIHAVGCRGPLAGIEERDQDFGAALAIQSAKWMMHDVDTRIASTFFEKDLLKVRAALKGGWTNHSAVMRATRLKSRDLGDAIKHLTETGEMVERKGQVSGRETKEYRIAR